MIRKPYASAEKASCMLANKSVAVLFLLVLHKATISSAPYSLAVDNVLRN